MGTLIPVLQLGKLKYQETKELSKVTQPESFSFSQDLNSGNLNLLLLLVKTQIVSDELVFLGSAQCQVQHGQSEWGLIMEGYCDLQMTVSMVGLVRPEPGLQEAEKGVCGEGRHSFETFASERKVWSNSQGEKDGIRRGNEDWPLLLLPWLSCMTSLLETQATPMPPAKSLFSDSFTPASALLSSQFPDTLASEFTQNWYLRQNNRS